VAALTQGKRRTLLETWLEWLYEAAQDAQALVIATECDEFRKLDWDRIRDAIGPPIRSRRPQSILAARNEDRRLRIPLFRPLRVVQDSAARLRSHNPENRCSEICCSGSGVESRCGAVV
jgi:hypothetical protein